LVVVKSEDGPEERVRVGVALVDQGQVQLDQNLLDVQTQQSGISFANYKKVKWVKFRAKNIRL
jgi:hypothetical protein